MSENYKTVREVGIALEASNRRITALSGTAVAIGTVALSVVGFLYVKIDNLEYSAARIETTVERIDKNVEKLVASSVTPNVQTRKIKTERVPSENGDIAIGRLEAKRVETDPSETATVSQRDSGISMPVFIAKSIYIEINKSGSIDNFPRLDGNLTISEASFEEAWKGISNSNKNFIRHKCKNLNNREVTLILKIISFQFDYQDFSSFLIDDVCRYARQP